MKPSDIETLSFKIIDKEAGEHNFSQKEWSIVRRMIHTSADFGYMKTVRFHHQAIEAGIKAIIQGKTIITDTQMAMSGISKKRLAGFNVKIKCLISDAEVKKKAAEKTTTRAHAAVDAAVSDMEDGIYVIGNAPTALLHLIELIKTGKAAPALVIGLPVGFVNAAESKAALIETDYPYITNIGRKGGSNIAASVINALANIAKGEHE
ncbi:MAG: precorrin-8X methylmutase [Deltaproteobacteria bacterium]|nr:precorrin-8X methylmutase [Deltaproteobacteria bacterium]